VNIGRILLVRPPSTGRRGRRAASYLGVRPGDRVVGYLHDIAETVVALRGAAAIGGGRYEACVFRTTAGSGRGIGSPGSNDRPVAAEGYRVRQGHDRKSAIGEIIDACPRFDTVVVVAKAPWPVPRDYDRLDRCGRERGPSPCSRGCRSINPL